MKEWLLKIVTPHFDDEQLNIRAFNLNVVLVSTLAVMLLGIVAMLLQVTSRPMSYVLPNTLFIVVAALVVAVCYRFSRRGRVQLGGAIFVIMMSVACIGAVFVGGTQGALGVILIIPVAAAGIALGSNVGLAVAILAMLALIVIGFLERGGAIQISYPAPETTILLNMFDVGFSIFFATLSIWLAGYSQSQALKRTRQAVVETDGYRRQLEESLDAEAEARNQLQRAISQYSAFLTRIGQGDYTARLSLSERDKDLAKLEQQINTTVDTLVTALARSEAAREDIEAAQGAQLLTAWRDYVRARAVLSFEAAASENTALREALRPALREAVTRKGTLTVTPVHTAPQLPSEAEPGAGTLAPHASAGGTGDEPQAGQSDAYTAVAVPIKLRGQVIGTLGLGREAEDRPWTQEERALVEAVAERLALAADNMRLREDTQRQAARERLIGEVTAHMRETLDVEAVLKTAAREVRQALGLPELVVRLGQPASNGGGEGEEVRS